MTENPGKIRPTARFAAVLAGARVTLAVAGPPPADGPARLAAFLDARLGGRPLDAVVGVPSTANMARYVADWASKVWPGLASVTWAGPDAPPETYVPGPRVVGEGHPTGRT